MTNDTLRANRPDIVGADTPESPYPVQLDSIVISGYGRGSSDLGIPTANIPQEAFDTVALNDTGIYFGWAKVSRNREEEKPDTACHGRDVSYNYGETLEGDELEVLPMVMSVGWNPFYGNKKKSAEIHIIHKFSHDFYGARVKLLILGYIRPELNYVSKEALIDDINTDIKVTLKSLDRPGYISYKTDGFLSK